MARSPEPAGGPPAPICLDLRGVACPLNWARAKAVLATMARGAHLELLVDDPRASSDIPRAAESEGHAVVELGPAGTARPVVTRIVIER
ncbi:MAG: sulfurtransferase TusA family protein [Deltaproteobacteria bacterium]